MSGAVVAYGLWLGLAVFDGVHGQYGHAVAECAVALVVALAMVFYALRGQRPAGD